MFVSTRFHGWRPPPPPSPPPCTKVTSMIAIFDHALARGYEPRRQRSTLAKAEGVRESEEKRKNEDKVVLMLTQGEKKKKNRRSNKATSATGSLFLPPTPLLPSHVFKTLRPSLFFFLLFSFLPVSHLPGFFWRSPTTVAAIVYQTERPTDRRTDGETDGLAPVCPLTETRKRTTTKKTLQHNKNRVKTKRSSPCHRRVVISRPLKT